MSTSNSKAATGAENFIAKIPKGLSLAGVFLMAWLIFFAWVVRLNSLPNLAQFLPAEETQAFWILDLEDLKEARILVPGEQSNFMGTPVQELSWIDRFGGAWTRMGDLTVAQVSSKSKAEAFLDSLKSPEEKYKKTQGNTSLWTTVTCYTESQPYCFTWVGDLLFVAHEKELLISIQQTALGEKENLKSEAKYQNVRGRLAHWNSGFYYIDLQEASPRFMDKFGIAAALLELFPSMGGTFKYQVFEGGDGVLAESFLGVDKTLLGGEAFYHNEVAYQQNLLPWSSNTLAWEWGGQNLAAQWERIGEILNRTSPSSGLLWEAQTAKMMKEWFGEDFDFKTELGPLLDGEQYFGFTPNADFLFISSLQPDEIKQVKELKDRLATHLKFSETHTDEKGETVLTKISPTVEQVQRNKTLNYEFKANDKVVLSLALLNEAFILSSSTELTLSTLDKAFGQAEARNLRELEGILPGSDEVLILHCPLLPDGNILKVLTQSFESILSTRKLFDDGVFSRAVLRGAQP